MKGNMHLIEDTYIRLFEDVGSRSGFSVIRGSCFEGLNWGLTVAPVLEKQLLDTLEGRPTLDEIPVPRYLRGLWDAATAGDKKSPLAVKYLRQLLLFVYKARLTYTHDQETTAYQKWQDLNQSAASWCLPVHGHSARVLDLAARLCQQRLASFRERELIPFHGPGAVLVPGTKHRWSTWYTTIDHLYKYGEYFHTSTGFDPMRDDYCGRVEDIIRCRAAAVPKDSRGPRLVFVHPAEAVWIQQGVRVMLEKSILSRQTAGSINFDDQRVNADLALRSSRDRKLATLDLSDASDRVPDILVQRMFGLRNYKHLGCCRASVASIQRNSIPIGMYAPMGNATTFPVESLIFWALSNAIQTMMGVSPISYVFGDDIIIPTEAYSAVVEGFSAFNLQVNQRKSFSKGPFRESCGTDAFSGVDVTPIRWKCAQDIECREDLVALSRLAARLRLEGYAESSRCVYDKLNRYSYRLFGRPLGCTNVFNHGAFAEYVNDREAWATAKWHKDYQMFTNRVMTLEHPREEVAHDWNHVLSSLTGLQRTGRGNDAASIAHRDGATSRWTVSWRPTL